MSQFVTVSEIACRRTDVFAHIVDLSKWTSFRGWGPLPGIVEASLPDGERMRPGARVRVRNTDGSIHHEVVCAFEPGRRYAVRMELSPPASVLMDRIEEHVELAETPDGGTRVTRKFVVTPRSLLTAPIVWFIARCVLREAVEAHNRAVGKELTGKFSLTTASAPLPPA